MATITNYSTHTVDIEDKRILSDNIVRDSIKLKTSERVTWTKLRKMSPVPQWNQQHAREPGFYLDFIKPKQTSRLVWELEAEYTPYKGGQIDADPLARPAIITFSTSLVEQPTFFDADRNPIVTRAGEFITGVMEQIPLVDYAVKKNLASDPKWLQTHLGAVNSDTVTLRGLAWKPKTLLLATVSGGEITTENRSTFAEYNLSILADARTWTKEVWNQGTVELVETYAIVRGVARSVWSQKKILRGDPPAPVDEPWMLDDDGIALRDHLQQDPTTPIKPNRLVILKFDTQKSLPFRNVLPLT